MIRFRRTLLPTLLVLLAASSVLWASEVPVYWSGHSDIRPYYVPGPPRFELKAHFDTGALFEDGSTHNNESIAADALAIRAPDPPIVRENHVGDPEDPDDDYDLSGPEWDFLGVEQDAPLWFMPQTNDFNKPFFGFATDLAPSQWSGQVTWSLEAIVSAPVDGHVSLWQTNFFGTPTVKYASYDGIDAVEDSFTQGLVGHDHYNWGFSRPGVYKVQLGATATRNGVGAVHGSGVFTFLVGDDAGEVLPGDYNGDGSVDAADYTVWRDTLGQSGSGLPADGDQDGEVNEADYLVWKDHFGEVSSPAAGSGGVVAAVPEPATLVLVLGLSFGIVFCSTDRIRT